MRYFSLILPGLTISTRGMRALSRDKLGAPYAIAISAENERDTREIVDGQLN